MPIEVRELIIRTRIEEPLDARPVLTETWREEIRRGLVAQCVAKVLEALEQRRER